MARIRFQDIHKQFGDNRVLRGVSFAVQRGHVHFVIGRSGAGKSVLTKLVVGLLQPSQGQVHIDEQRVSHLSEREFFEIRKRCQLIFQHATLFDALSVLENIAMPLRKRFALSGPSARDAAMEALSWVDGAGLAHRLPAELGSGVKKRVAIARALALKPEILLYDEPTTSLDPVAARRTDRLICETTKHLNLTSLVVSHDLQSVQTGDKVTFLHEGKAVFDGTPAELFACDDAVVREFVHGSGARWQADSATLTLAR